MNKNIVHEIGNYLQQIISSAEYITKCSDITEYSEKIKTAAYKIDALIIDATNERKKINLKEESVQGINLALFRNLNVLIVDDIIENIHIMENIFSTLSCNILSAMSGEEAIESYKKGFVPDIVCMDMMMPGMDGATATKELKKLGLEAYFIAITALKNQKNDIVSIFDCWLPKPFTLEHIKGALSGYQAFEHKDKVYTKYKLKNSLPFDIQELILELVTDGAYTKLSKVIESLDESESKDFLKRSLLNVDFNSIRDSITCKKRG